MRDEAGGSLQSVNRALTALELVADAGELGVSELGRQLGVHKATASRLAAVLADRGLLERDPSTERYRIGFGLVRLAGAAMSGLDLVRLARPILESLAERVREATNLGVRSGDDVVYVDQIAGSRAIVTVSWVGKRTPMHCTSNGKVLLAWADEADRERVLAGELETFTEHTVIDPTALRRELNAIRTRGYAQALEELEEGLNAVAAPVRQADGRVIAALGVSGPAFRMHAVDVPRLGLLTAEAAQAVSRQLGYLDRGRVAG
ncbi:MAG TPA: IclR family transcriptional regulator [Actinomycetota bacterium]|nr:IclR family transcriptional regulator [Actinomycetota bacterium]